YLLDPDGRVPLAGRAGDGRGGEAGSAEVIAGRPDAYWKPGGKVTHFDPVPAVIPAQTPEQAGKERIVDRATTGCPCALEVSQANLGDAEPSVHAALVEQRRRRAGVGGCDLGERLHVRHAGADRPRGGGGLHPPRQ